ncbi:MAG: hypothetical protein WCE43_02140 [Burkholderiales bacterium]
MKKQNALTVSLHNSNYFVLCLWVLVAGGIMGSGRARGAQPEPGTYKVEKGRVDRNTYLGWKLFHTTCFTCHGRDATGTEIAPNLTERIKFITPRDFATKVMTSYRITVPSGDMSGNESSGYRDAVIEEVMRKQRGEKGSVSMPAWETSSKVKPHILDLYAYLTARADGALGPGKPKIISAK